MEKTKKVFRGNIRQYGMIIALVVILLLFTILTNGTMVKPLNVTNLIMQNSYILVLAMGMLLVILTGNIDLSVGSVVAFVGAVTAIFMTVMNIPVFVAILLALVIGVVVGAWNGWWISFVRIPAFIATLASMLIFRGLTMVLLQGKTIAPLDESYTAIAGGYLGDITQSEGLNILALIIGAVCCALYILFEINKHNGKKRYHMDTGSIAGLILKCAIVSFVIMIIAYTLAQYKGIPTVFILLAALAIIYSFIATKTRIGRRIYAYGGNAKAAELSGINTRNVLFITFVNMGLIAAIAGVVFSARLNSATPSAGQNFELDAIAACFIGGASASGGIGTIFGAIVGGLIMGVLNNGMSLMGVSVDWQQAIKGLVLLLAVAFDVYTKSKATKV